MDSVTRRAGATVRYLGMIAFAAAVVIGFGVRAAELEQPTLKYVGPSQLLTLDGANTYLHFQLWMEDLDPDTYRWRMEWSTNNGASWVVGSNHSPGYTMFESRKQPEGTVWKYRAVILDQSVSRFATSAPPVTVWAEMQPRNLKAKVQGTNEVLLTFNDINRYEDGFLVQRATNSTFGGTLKELTAPPTANADGTPAESGLVDTGFEGGQTYWWRAYATNAAGYRTEASTSDFAAPNAMAGAPERFNVYNDVAGVRITWVPGGGIVDRWYLQAGVNNTNTFETIYSPTSSSYSATRHTDLSQTPGDTCYYRVGASNRVGVVWSETKTVIIPAAIDASEWYVDAAADGNNNGTNWANAFPTFASIGWRNIKPGALIWIAAGSYPEIAYCNVSGASNAPITFKVAQDAAHAGKVRLNGIFSYRNYIHWDGAKSDSFELTSVESITNNINLVVGSTNNPVAVYFSQRPARGTSLKWIEVAECMNPERLYTNSGTRGEGVTAGISIRGGSVGHGDNEIAYIWCHDLEGDGIDTALHGLTDYGGIHVHHSLVERCRGNMLSGTGGDYHDLVLRDEWRADGGNSPPGVHPDGAQMYPPFLRFYNNVIRNTTGQSIFIEVNTPVVEGVLVYNNVIYGTGGTTWTNEDGSVTVKEINNGISFQSFNSTQFPLMTLTNVLIANNTLWNFPAAYLGLDFATRTVESVSLRNWTVANNIFHTPTDATAINFTSAAPLTNSNVRFDWNNICGSNTTVTLYGTNHQAAATPGFANNFSYNPEFANADPTRGKSFLYDFHLTSEDAVYCVGTNLTAWESLAPGLARNPDGTVRSADAWPVGAYGQAVEGRWPSSPTFLRIIEEFLRSMESP